MVATEDTSTTTIYGVGMWQMHDMGSGRWLLMAMMIVAVVAVVIWLVANSPRSDDSSGRSAPGSPPVIAIGILDRRLAAGEITIEDYEQRRRTLARDLEHTAA